MNRFIMFVLIIASIACAENVFWKEFDCPNKNCPFIPFICCLKDGKTL